METESLECRSLDLAANASTRLPLEHGGTLFAYPSTSKENFTRASLHTEICTPEVSTFADLAKFTSISKEKYESIFLFIFAPHNCARGISKKFRESNSNLKIDRYEQI